MSNTYEIEVKCLLGSKDNCEKLKQSLQTKRPSTKLISASKQLNHYFVGGDSSKLYKVLSPYIQESDLAKFERVVKEGHKSSVRTRQTDTQVIFVIKASIGSHTSANGVERIEFEAVMPMNLEKLDSLMQDAGYNYQAKWSRERQEYDTGDMHVCIDRNAGYGYVAEFEKVLTDKSQAEKASREIREFMGELGVAELPQDRLERMFAHYNANWRDYYGTEKIFVVE